MLENQKTRIEPLININKTVNNQKKTLILKKQSTEKQYFNIIKALILQKFFLNIFFSTSLIKKIY